MSADPSVSAWLRVRSPIDRTVALAALVVVSPLLVLLGIAIRRGDRGPAVISLDRVGQAGRPFRLYKLRTMVPSGADGRAAGSTLTSFDDRRVTPLGGALRRRRLDELPQLLNVLRGDMLLLGPRPESPGFVDATSRGWRDVLRVRPGIAGPTQLLVADWEGRALPAADAERVYREEILPVKLRIDAWYVANASPRIDAMIALSLVERFILGRPVTRVHRRLAGMLPAAAQPSGLAP